MEANPSETPRSRKKGVLRTLLIGLALLLLIAAASAYAGYANGMQQRRAAEATQIASDIQTQFQLGLEDLQAKRYDLARQRFEFVLEQDPNYPGAVDKLTEAMLALNATATPTIVPTPTLTPTPDLRGEQQLFEQAQAALQEEDWDTAIETLLALRKRNASYQAVQVDGMLYIALRNRGVQKILQQADLEGGTYDLALAERFGPLDAEAKNYRIWVSLYVTGASFWEIDWGQAAYYFGQVAPLAPNLRDASGMTASQRYLIATQKYADYLMDNKAWCKAEEQYRIAQSLGADVEKALKRAHNKCSPPTPTPLPPTPTPEGGAPSPTPGG
ncbi:MAG: hypothetical protein D6755_02945 [Anaerolineae bacterium]|nr:MAG: hypothetical protein D6755_02945 [Anaerolineae bacterium]